MAKQRPTELCVGFELDSATAAKVITRLGFVCELGKGAFTWRHQDSCTVFTAPRPLGVTTFRIASALLEGFKIGVFN